MNNLADRSLLSVSSQIHHNNGDTQDGDALSTAHILKHVCCKSGALNVRDKAKMQSGKNGLWADCGNILYEMAILIFQLKGLCFF